MGELQVEAEVERDDVVAVFARVGEQRPEPDDGTGEAVELRADDPAGEPGAAPLERALEPGPVERAAGLVEVFVPLDDLDLRRASPIPRSRRAARRAR